MTAVILHGDEVCDVIHVGIHRDEMCSVIHAVIFVLSVAYAFSIVVFALYCITFVFIFIGCQLFMISVA